MSLFPDQLLWEKTATVNLSCGLGRMECDILKDLGPPPDMILSIPPPPMPPSLEELVSRLAGEAMTESVGSDGSATCNLCHWAAKGSNVGFVELAQKGPVIDDTWFLVIISSCVAAALIAIVLAIACFKYRDGKLKPLSDVALAKKEKALGLERCEAVLYPGPPSMPPPMPPSEVRSSTKALWAGLKPLDEKFYTVDHCQPMSQKQARMDIIQNMEDKYDYKHYTPVNYATLSPAIYSSASYGGEDALKNGPTQTFENVGFVPGEENVNDQNMAQNYGVSRAAYLLGGSGRATISRPEQQPPLQHHYEMVAPRNSPSSKRLMSLDRKGRHHNNNNKTPTISAPTNVLAVRLPPLNSRRYALTALANGRHTLSREPEAEVREARRSQVALDRTGGTMTSLAPTSPTDHVYASPITSPVI